MKTLQLKKRMDILFILCLSMLAHRSFGQEPCTGRVTFANEPPLDIEHHIISAQGATDHRRRFDAQFRNGNSTTPYELSPEVLPMRAIVDLYCMAAKKLEEQAEGRCKGKGCVTGLKITLGQEATNIVYFYQPVYLYSTTNEGKEKSYHVENYEPANFYRFINGKFEPQQDTTGACRTYREHVLIGHKDGSDNFERMRFHGNWQWTSDTRSILFSFQEIFTLYHRRFNESDSSLYGESISINTGAANFRRKRRIRIWSNWQVKHTLYMGTVESLRNERTAGRDVLVAVADDGTNFAHLCPPSCNDVTLNSL